MPFNKNSKCLPVSNRIKLSASVLFFLISIPKNRDRSLPKLALFISFDKGRW